MKHDRKILPIAERLKVDSRYAGRGVTIAFLDSGFYAHPDLTTPHDRILSYHDIFVRRTSREALYKSDVSSWHGMMSSVVATGNGSLSEGRFKGLAYEANVVLVKVGSANRIVHDDIRRGLEWAIAHRQKYDIRVINISCGGDFEVSYLTDPLCKAADAAVRAGIVVVAAVGNTGHHQVQTVLPPASAPSVLAVGGFDDGGEGLQSNQYHSSYGPTIDGLQKPEVVAPAIWVAAPILPGTPTSDQAKLIALLDQTEDHRLQETIRSHGSIDPDLDAIACREPYLVRQLISIKRRDQKVISGHYKHVDGTSFAAPIVSSVVAQMIEANPRLSPQQVKQLLIRTAKRLPNIPQDQQGWGLIQPASAIESARKL